MVEFKTKFKSVKYGKMAYFDEGEGFPLLFVHGLPTSKVIWIEIMAQFVSTNRCIAIDLLDYGESEKIEENITHKNRAENIIGFIANMELKNVTLITHDLGSSIAIDIMGIGSPNISRLVIMSPPVYPDFVEPFIVRLARKRYIGGFLVGTFKGIMFSIGIKMGMARKKKFTKQMSKALLEPFKGKHGSSTLLRILRWGSPKDVFEQYPDFINGIKIPTLLIQGEKDPYIPKSQITRMNDSIRDSKLVMLAGASHFITLDFSDEIVSELNKFFKDH